MIRGGSWNTKPRNVRSAKWRGLVGDAEGLVASSRRVTERSEPEREKIEM
jgi:hypothetical protein